MKDHSSKAVMDRASKSAVLDLEHPSEGDESSHVANGSDPPPIYEELIEEINIAEEDFSASARILDDGRVNINIDLNQGYLSGSLAPEHENHLREVDVEKGQPVAGPSNPHSLTPTQSRPEPPSLNLVMHVVGSRSDVQPFVALGRVFKELYNHRVRLATHPIFQELVEENGLEFFSIGGDLAALMAFMVKNPRFMPTIKAIKRGDISTRRKEIYEIMKGCWRSCYEAGDGTGDGTGDGPNASSLRGTKKEFVANAIIANPPSFAHIHCAQKLGIPLHLMFTMPWSPTQAFPHPLANIQPSNIDTSLKNFMSYPMVEMMLWQGLGGTINMFRSKVLALEPVRLLWGPKAVSKLKIPHTYLWSPFLIPKPDDWGSHISVTGFVVPLSAPHYVPDPELEEFLSLGPTPIYIGFESVEMGETYGLLQLLFEAIRRSGQRAVISSGDEGLVATSVPESVLIVGNVPYDWIFARVSCVIHNGGSGATAAGIRLGKPTVIVPFSGDQFFWGSMIARAGAGPQPIPFRELELSKLATAIEIALNPNFRQHAQELGQKMQGENGAETSALSFHHQLDLNTLSCSLDPSRNAVWKVRRSDVRISSLGATVLIDAGLLRFKDLSLYRPREYDLEDGPWDPITGTISACLNMVGSMMMGFADVPVEIHRARKAKVGAASSSKNVRDSHIENSIAASHHLSSEVETIFPGVPHSEDSSRAFDGGLDESASSSPYSRSSNHSEPWNFDKQANSPTDLQSAQVSEGASAAPGSSDSRLKKNYRTVMDPVLQTSSGVVLGTSKGVGRIIVAGLKSPFEVTLSVARGFHNAPRLYGNQTVRPAERITGVWSGLRAAGKGLTYGVYDGVSGLWMQPINGSKKEGTLGLWKGVGKGLGGLALKPVAGTWGVLGYTFEGVNKEVQKLFGSNVESHIITSRKAQGFEEFRIANADEKALVIERWQSVGALI